MEKTRSITFDKEAQMNLPQHVKDKMKSDRAKAEKESLKCKHRNAYFVGSVGEEYCPDCNKWTMICD